MGTCTIGVSEFFENKNHPSVGVGSHGVGHVDRHGGDQGGGHGVGHSVGNSICHGGGHGVGHGGGHGAYASAMGPRESASRPPAAAEDTQG